MSQTVPASTKIKRTRVANIDTDRLLRRADFLVAVELPALTRDGGAASRNDYANRAAELALVEDELDARGADRPRKTIPYAQRLRYAVSPSTGASFPISRPPKHYSQAGQPVD